ncbi:MAG: apolipoprotein N-acyltransferase [Thermogutta sp.]
MRVVIATCAPILSGILLGFGFCDKRYWWFGWLGLIPLHIGLINSKSKIYGYCGAYLGGLVFFGMGLMFLTRMAEGALIPAYVVIVAGAATSWMAAALLITTVRLPATFGLPVAWVAIEWIRSQLFAMIDGSGLPFLYLGELQAQCLPLLQVADIGGVWALSWLFATVNGVFCDLLVQISAKPAFFVREAKSYSLMVAIAVLLSSFLYGSWRLAQNRKREGPVVALVPGFLCPECSPQIEARQIRQKIAAQLNIPDITQRVKRDNTAKWPTLFVWGEHAMPRHTLRFSPPPGAGSEDYAAQFIARLARELSSTIVVGGFRSDRCLQRSECMRISAFCVDGRGDLIAVVDKFHLVPGVDFVPNCLQRPVTWMPKLFGLAEVDLAPGVQRGDKAGLAHLKPQDCDVPVKMGMVVCYDVFFPQVHRRLLRNNNEGDGADFFVGVAYEPWGRECGFSTYSVIHAQIRAVEFRRSYCRVSQGGYSVFIDNCGRIQKIRSESDNNIVVDRMSVDRERTLYAILGDWLPCFCLLGITANIGRSRFSCRTNQGALVRWWQP